MAINGPNPLSGPDTRSLGAPLSNERVSAGTPAEASLDISEPAGRFTFTTDLTQLLVSVRQTAEVRQEVVGEVARRLTSGELLTRDSAERTVQGILESQRLGDF